MTSALALRILECCQDKEGGYPDIPALCNALGGEDAFRVERAVRDAVRYGLLLADAAEVSRAGHTHKVVVNIRTC